MRTDQWARFLPGRGSKFDPYDIAAVLLLLTLIVLVLKTYGSYAISNDEAVQQRYGEMIIAYYTSGFTDRSLFGFKDLYLYGGLFDVTATLIAKVLPFELYHIRHVLCAATGIAGVAAAFATARLVAGSRAGLFAALMLALCGSWYGGMFNHTKDITFAAAMMGASYFLIRAIRDAPRPRFRDILGFGLLLGAALGIRVMGLLLPIYLVVAVLLRLTGRDAAPDARQAAAFATRSLLVFAPALALGYAIMLVAWPWAALDWLNPVRAIISFADFHYVISTQFAGRVYQMADVPRAYVPIYLLIKLPLVMLAGGALALLFAVVPRRWLQGPPAQTRREIALLGFMVMFPVLCQVIGRGPAFTGLRHFLYVVPPLAVLGGIGCDALLTRLACWHRGAAAGAGAMLTAALLWNADVLLRLHPYEYLVYNPLVGGLQGAQRRYATDYWVNIMPEAVADLEGYIARTDPPTPRALQRRYRTAVCGDRLPFENIAGPDLEWTPDWDHADFFIAPTHMDCDRALDGKVIARIERLGTLIGVVKDRRGLSHPAVARAANAPVNTHTR